MRNCNRLYPFTVQYIISYDNTVLYQEIEEMTTELATKKRLMKSLDEMVIWWQNELECLSREQNQLQDIISVNTAE